MHQRNGSIWLAGDIAEEFLRLRRSHREHNRLLVSGFEGKLKPIAPRDASLGARRAVVANVERWKKNPAIIIARYVQRDNAFASAL